MNTVTLNANEMITAGLAIDFALRYIKEVAEKSKALGLDLPNLSDDTETMNDLHALRKRLYVNV